MEFKEYSEKNKYPDYEDNNLDDLFERNVNLNSNNFEEIIEKGDFDNKNIENTKEKRNYNYLLLMRELIHTMSYEELTESLKDCGLKLEDIYNPTPEMFEKLRNYYINIYNKKR